MNLLTLLKIGDLTLHFHKLDNGKTVIEQSEMAEFTARLDRGEFGIEEVISLSKLLRGVL